MRQLLAAAALLLLLPPPVTTLAADLRAFSDRVWFAPAPGSLDMGRLFDTPSDWTRARDTITVFKFYQQHTQQDAAIVGPNRYDALVRSGAFTRLSRDWRKRIALEAGAVKDFYCTADASGMNAAIADTQKSLDAIRTAGGIVTYLAMDEPFFAGLSPQCGGGTALEPTADRLQTYMLAIRRKNAALRVGLIEAYPSFAPAKFAEMLALMRDRGVPASFLHVDIDLGALKKGRDELGRDLIRLSDVAAEYRIPYGIIIWGGNGNADALYSADARRLTDAVHKTFRDWSVMPDHIIFQSWAESSTGLRITPSNLPESRADTHTFLINDLYQQLRFGRIPR